MYLIFGGECFYAGGAGNDLIDIKEGRQEAIDRAKELMGQHCITYEDKDEDYHYIDHHPVEWAQVVDGSNGEIVHHEGGKPCGTAKPLRICSEEEIHEYYDNQ